MSTTKKRYWPAVARISLEPLRRHLGGLLGYAFAQAGTLWAVPVVWNKTGWEDARMEIALALGPTIAMLLIWLVSFMRAPRVLYERQAAQMEQLEAEHAQERAEREAEALAREKADAAAEAAARREAQAQALAEEKAQALAHAQARAAEEQAAAEERAQAEALAREKVQALAQAQARAAAEEKAQALARAAEEKAALEAEVRALKRAKETNTDWVEHGTFRFEYDINAQWAGQAPDVRIECGFQENHSGEYSVVFSPTAALVYEFSITEKRRNGFTVHVGYSGLMALDDPETVEVTWQAVGKD